MCRLLRGSFAAAAELPRVLGNSGGRSHFCVGSLWGPQPLLPSFVAWSLVGEPDHHLLPSMGGPEEIILSTHNGGETSGPLPILGMKKSNSLPCLVGIGAF